MDGQKGKFSTGKRQVQPISPQLKPARPGAGRPRATGMGSKRARSDDESEMPPPEPRTGQVMPSLQNLACDLHLQHLYQQPHMPGRNEETHVSYLAYAI